MGKPTICIGVNKDADQLRSKCEADQRLCFRYSDSTINPKFQASSSFLCLYRSVCVSIKLTKSPLTVYDMALYRYCAGMLTTEWLTSPHILILKKKMTERKCERTVSIVKHRRTLYMVRQKIRYHSGGQLFA